MANPRSTNRVARGWLTGSLNAALRGVVGLAGWVPQSMQLIHSTTREVAALSRDIPVVIPVAAIEQHGSHLPVFTDSLLLGEIVRRAELRLGERALFAPLLWLGNSHHHLDFPGTLSAAPRVYLDVLAELAENFIHHGFRRILFLNGHGGNDVPGRQAMFEVRQRHRKRNDLLLVFGTYWQLGAGPAREEGPAGGSFVQDRMGHACEWETSMMLRLDQAKVKDWKNLEPVPFGNPFEPAHRAWVTQDRTAPGHIGSPHAATAEKGETLFEMFAGAVVGLVGRVARWDGTSWDG